MRKPKERTTTQALRQLDAAAKKRAKATWLERNN